jgi:hypothetical protein
MIKSRMVIWAEHRAHMGYERDTCRVSMEKPEGKRLLRRPRHKGKIIFR